MVNDNASPSSFEPNINHQYLQGKGLKRRDGVKNCGKRQESWVENQPKKKREGKSSNTLQIGGKVILLATCMF